MLSNAQLQEEWDRLGQEQAELQRDFQAAPIWKRLFLIWHLSYRHSEVIKRRQIIAAELWKQKQQENV